MPPGAEGRRHVAPGGLRTPVSGQRRSNRCGIWESCDEGARSTFSSRHRASAETAPAFVAIACRASCRAGASPSSPRTSTSASPSSASCSLRGAILPSTSCGWAWSCAGTTPWRRAAVASWTGPLSARGLACSPIWTRCMQRAASPRPGARRGSSSTVPPRPWKAPWRCSCASRPAGEATGCPAPSSTAS